ncbi:class I SAM-dependent methyltransferase [Sinomicrobium soli]|uniref:class I SAM-dependent methyltransferase n=1 Tax=Sinomicrobium sp. N-1-3-6 TaxID=2219864 RepID=UPI000DCCC5AF|nr:class I SAM-dependent methyltransferase [Sinomicrobium sp. N-1-3-6]RAV29044.1 SAM-dependent methyltransferase [Sinomicrobium sp. N-1-3-6]
MPDPWLKRWENRYADEAYAFGILPNEYLKEQLRKFEPGDILFPAEGEGRNAVFAALEGWNVSAFDISAEGRKKALKLAGANDVSIDYKVGELPDLGYREEQFDTIALIYAHFPAAIKSEYHRLLDRYVRRGGIVIFEGFGKEHLEYRMKNPKVGGPVDMESLFSEEELKSDFKDYDVIELCTREVTLHEGLYHNGKGSVIRFVGRKR